MRDEGQMRFLVTGGSGFIGSAVVRNLIRAGHTVFNVDSMTYAASEAATAAVFGLDAYEHLRIDITDRSGVEAAFGHADPDVVMHLAAESHVDRSIDNPSAFVMTNVVGTTNLLAAAADHFRGLDATQAERFRFHHVSTDEVFGTLGDEGAFDEDTAYDPRSPYSASKAASDHFARAWFHTYGLPVVLSNCSNNYGPFQQPEKLIPKTIINALRGVEIPVYGSGAQVRDWLHVDDHVRGLVAAALTGEVGHTYLFGGAAERTSLDVVTAICEVVDDVGPITGRSRDLISFVEDRPGHDHRYAIDFSATTAALGWTPEIPLATGLRSTVEWYVANEQWWAPLLDNHGATDRQGLPS